MAVYFDNLGDVREGMGPEEGGGGEEVCEGGIPEIFWRFGALNH